MRIINKGNIVLIYVALISLLFSCSKFDQIEAPIKNFASIDGYVVIQGHWKKTNGNCFKPHRINATSITCDKKAMTCKEIIAELLTPREATAFHFDKPRLFIDDTTYEIITWSSDVINARYLAPVADFELKISIKDKLAERRWRETKARGTETSNPNNYGNWILE